MDWILTGASRGIGRALAHELARRAQPDDRLFALARDTARLRDLAASAAKTLKVVTVPVDLSRLAEVRRVGAELAGEVRRATLIHDAGVWPAERTLVDGLETAFVVNGLAPLVLQQPLLDAGRLARVLVVSAGLLVKGRFDAKRTPTGADFSRFRTYATTKLAGAAALRAEARRFPDVDFAFVHPGVVATDLGASTGILGWLLELVKRRWERPETCAARLVRILDRERWSRTAGEAPWFFLDEERPWPVEVEAATPAVTAEVTRLAGAAAAR